MHPAAIVTVKLYYCNPPGISYKYPRLGQRPLRIQCQLEISYGYSSTIALPGRINTAATSQRFRRFIYFFFFFFSS